MADRDDMIRKVQALWAKAEDSAATPAEREAAEEKAKELMAKYVIDEIVLEQGKKGAEDIVTQDVVIYMHDADKKPVVPDARVMLCHYIVTNNRCKGVVTEKYATVTMDGKPQKSGKYYQIVGYRSDVELAHALYRELAPEMLFQLLNEPTDHMKKAEKDEYSNSFAQGYADRINWRLRKINHRVEEVAQETNGMALVLVSRADKLAERFVEMWPNLGTTRIRRPKDPNAVNRGAAAADRADLASGKMGTGSKGALGR